MMDERRNVFGLGSQPNSNFKQLSPYLNVDPNLLQTQAPEFIMDQEMTRGKLENSFTAIGTGLFVGAAAGGFYGFFDGIRHASASNMAGKLRKTAIINHTLKSGKKNHRFYYTNIKWNLGSTKSTQVVRLSSCKNTKYSGALTERTCTLIVYCYKNLAFALFLPA